MPRSQDFIRSAFAQETEDVWLVLLTISHADLSEDIRVVNNTVNITSRGLMFTASRSTSCRPSNRANGSRGQNW